MRASCKSTCGELLLGAGDLSLYVAIPCDTGDLSRTGIPTLTPDTNLNAGKYIGIIYVYIYILFLNVVMQMPNK